ncbi:succinate dehydrogenase assembly factor 2, partial [Dimargaris cristalligena]
VERTGETLESQRKRIIYQSRKRGILENDLLLSNFVQRNVPLYNAAQLLELDMILDMPDWDLYYFMTDKQEPLPELLVKSTIWPSMKAYVREKRTSVLMMPAL